MRRLLRHLTLTSSFVALQLTLLGGGPGCPMPAPGAAHASASAEHESVRVMPGMAMAGAAADADGAVPEPCDGATAPTACATMTPCLFAAIAPSVAVDAPSSDESSRVVAALVLTPPSETAAPELPPPRA